MRAGVDINTVRGWLGHVSLETTNVYAEVDFETKAKASFSRGPKSSRGGNKQRRQKSKAVLFHTGVERRGRQ
ncbi:hypothetical protein NKI23_31410 [Mesorhizobium sp. M0809]